MRLRFFLNFKFLILIIGLMLYPIFSVANSKNLTLKIAIIDNFHYQKLSSETYATYYLNGIDIAIDEAKKMHIFPEYKIFTYGSAPLDILKTVEKVKNWQPDLIIGPRSSNLFLLLNGQFSNAMVLSPYATANMINTLPKNFYSLTPPGHCTANAIALTVIKMFPNKHVISLVQADCKSCMDISRKFNQKIASSSPKIKTYIYPLIMNHIQTMPISNTLVHYKPGDIIFLPDISYQTAMLMPRITNLLGQPIIFIGDDEWGDWNDAMVGRIKAKYPYWGYRIDAWSIYDKDSKVVDFRNRYLRKYKIQPNAISYVSYVTALSIIKAIEKYPKFCGNKITQNCLLKTYQIAVKNDPLWFRSRNYFIHKVDLNGESYIGKIYKINKESTCLK